MTKRPMAPDIELVTGSDHCLYSILENKLAAISRNQRRLAIRLDAILAVLAPNDPEAAHDVPSPEG